MSEPSGPDSADAVGARPTAQSRRGSGRSVLAGLLLAAILAGVSIAAVTVARPAPITPTAGSPTAAVETYAAAVLAGDTATAWSMLSPKGRMNLTYDEYREMGFLPSDMKQSLDVTGETVAGSSARVTADLTMSFDPSFGGDSTQSVGIDLVLGNDGAWLIDEPMYGLMPETGF